MIGENIYTPGSVLVFNKNPLSWGAYPCLLAVLLLSGCTVASNTASSNTVSPNTVAPITVAPIEEIRLFLKAFVAVDEASRALFNDLAIAERRQGRQNAENKAKSGICRGECEGIAWARLNPTSGYIAGFCVEDAPYFSELGYPPATERAYTKGKGFARTTLESPA